MFNLEKCSLIRLNNEYDLKSFDCDDSDLNDFYLNDCKNYQNQLLAVTYILELGEDTVAFYSLLNDKISITDVDATNKWNRIRKQLPQRKRFKSYPAMKIGRLAVATQYKNFGVGTYILDSLKQLFITNNRTGCRFITVDAYKQSLRFYERNGFQFLSEKNDDTQTRLMFFDLATLTAK